MKKIVIDARESGTTTGRYVDKLLESLHRLQPPYEIIVLTKKHRLEFMQKVAPGFRVVECPFKEFTLAEQVGFYRQLRRLKPALVHFPMAQQPVLYRGKVVTTMNDLTSARFRNPAKNRLVFSVKQGVYRWLNKRVARKSAALLTYSQFVKNDVVKFTGVNPAKITVTPLAADPITDAARALPELQGKPFIMYVGRALPHKNLNRLLEAFELLKARRPEPLALVLAGHTDANYQRLAAAARKRNIRNVIFTGHVDEGQLRWLYEHCSAYVFPSLSEGFGLPGLEAMAHGAPAVSSNATCLPEVYGQAALYFDPLNIKAMADAINEVVGNQDLRQKLIQAGRAQTAKYSWQRTAEQTLAVYVNILK
jgi:glycosyltransferase involved in cell wall biosynthesis